MTEGIFNMQEVHIDNLFAACERIEAVFRPIVDGSASDEEVAGAEQDVREEINTLCLNLYALATADLKTRAKRGGFFLLDSVLYNFEEIASEAANIPFSTRTDEGVFSGVMTILDFFSTYRNKGKNATAKDLFDRLYGLTINNVSLIIKKIFRSEKSLLHYIHNAVSRHIRVKERYTRKGRFVVDDTRSDNAAGGEDATAEELIALCSPELSGSEKPGTLVDLIFDRIIETGKYRSVLEINLLRHAVFELIKVRFAPPDKRVNREDPYQDYLLKQMLETAARIIDETAENYGWRDSKSARFRELYVKAARFRLEEIIRSGRTPSSARAFMEVQDGGGEDYEHHKGPFQNFWKNLWDRFIDYF